MARINQLAGQLTGNSGGWPGPGMGLEVSTATGPVMPGAPAGEGVSQFAAGTIQPLWFNVSVLVAWVAVAIAVSLWVNAKRDVK
nr:hypothetical protein [Corynebacterium lactis]